MFRKILIGTLIAGMLVVGGSSTVFAQAENPPVCPPETNILEELDMTREDVKAALEAGQTIEDLFAEAGLDYDTYLQEHADAQLACIEQALENGTITQEQADRMMEAINTALEQGKPFNLGKVVRKHNTHQKARFASFENIAEAFDMTTDELREALADGTTIGELADELGVDLDEMVEEWINTQIADIEAAVESGKITQEKADEMITRLNTLLEEGFDFENWNPRTHSPKNGEMIVNAGKDLAQEVLEAFGMTPEEIKAAIQNGQTIEELAAENGVDLDAIFAEWVAEKSAVIKQAVADGKITEEKAAEMLERLETQAEEGFPLDFLKKVRQGRDGQRPIRNGEGSGEGRTFPFQPEGK